MNVINRSNNTLNKYKEFYKEDYPYFGNSWLRPGDAFPAVCYAYGLFDIRDVDYPLDEQIDIIKNNSVRTPRSVLEIGSGRGDVSQFFSNMGSKVFSIDCNPFAEELQKHTKETMYNNVVNDYTLGIGALEQFLDDLPTDIDTIVMIESIEHIFPNEWAVAWARLKDILSANHGRLIITNVIHPVGTRHDPTPEHVMEVDDQFFNQLENQCKGVVFRRRGNICLDF